MSAIFDTFKAPFVFAGEYFGILTPEVIPAPKEPLTQIEVLKEEINKIYEIALEKGYNYSEPVRKFVGDCFKEDTQLGQAYATASEFVKTHALHIGYAGAATGGMIATDSAINLLQKKANSPVKEITKIAIGSGLVALSMAYATEDAVESSRMTTIALGAGLADAIVRATIAVKPTFLVFQLKSKDKHAIPQEVVFIPKKLEEV